MNFRLGVVIQILTALCTYVSCILGDNTGLLMSTLFTFQDHVCENEKLRIRCPHETTINIQWAQYGRQVPSHKMCSPFGRSWPLVQGPSHLVEEDLNCLAPTALQIVLDKCQDRRHCVIEASTRGFGQDPCPETSKYLEVAYKCRPNMFMSRVSCDGEQMQIKCDSEQRIAIYSAMFGRDLKGSLECPAEPEFDTDCESPCSVGVVMRMCHRKKRCNIPVTETNFGNACPIETPKYLSVVYTCVPKRILKEINSEDRFPQFFCGEEGAESLEPEEPEEVDDNDGWLPPETDLGPDEDVRGGDTDRVDHPDNLPGYRPDPSIHDYGDQLTPSDSMTPPVSGDDNLHENSSEAGTAEPDVSPVKEGSVGFISDWLYTWQFLEENKEKFILYLILGLFVGLVLLLLVIIMKLMMTRRTKKKKAKLNISEPVASSSPGSRPEDMTLLDHSSHSDGIEMLSYNRQATLSRPSPFQSHSAGAGTNSNTNSNNRVAKNYYG